MTDVEWMVAHRKQAIDCADRVALLGRARIVGERAHDGLLRDSDREADFRNMPMTPAANE
ncbi:hypothetical protein [Actinomadura napierensis]|uniref:Uncharacterized protein n=1 Tax=Actinomadura napierensis TaxID=267854 RepID=A0ABP5KD38_9ACTN